MSKIKIRQQYEEIAKFAAPHVSRVNINIDE